MGWWRGRLLRRVPRTLCDSGLDGTGRRGRLTGLLEGLLHADDKLIVDSRVLELMVGAPDVLVHVVAPLRELKRAEPAERQAVGLV